MNLIFSQDEEEEDDNHDDDDYDDDKTLHLDVKVRSV